MAARVPKTKTDNMTTGFYKQVTPCRGLVLSWPVANENVFLGDQFPAVHDVGEIDALLHHLRVGEVEPEINSSG